MGTRFFCSNVDGIEHAARRNFISRAGMRKTKPGVIKAEEMEADTGI